MAFSFGFSGDDIDIDDSEINNDFSDVPSQQTVGNSLPELVKPIMHDTNEWVSDKTRCFILNCAYFATSFVICLELASTFYIPIGPVGYCPLSLTRARKHEFEMHDAFYSTIEV